MSYIVSNVLLVERVTIKIVLFYCQFVISVLDCNAGM